MQKCFYCSVSSVTCLKIDIIKIVCAIKMLVYLATKLIIKYNQPTAGTKTKSNCKGKFLSREMQMYCAATPQGCSESNWDKSLNSRIEANSGKADCQVLPIHGCTSSEAFELALIEKPQRCLGQHYLFKRERRTRRARQEECV